MDQTVSPAALPYGAFKPQGNVRRLMAMTRAMPATWLGKRLGFALRKLAIWSLGGKPVDAEAFGVRFRLHPYQNVCEKRILFSPRDFDQAERDYLGSRIREGFTFVDIGANIGGYALAVAAMAGPGAHVLAFEPQPEIFERLSYNIAANPFGTVKAMAIAVADRDGEMTLFLDPRNKGEASVKIVSSDNARQVRVPARPLLSLLREEGLARLDAIKLDVEGAEDIILQRFFADAPETLWPSVIIIERGESRWSVDLLGELGKHGYRAVAGTRNNHILER